jgi:hypothetical protein
MKNNEVEKVSFDNFFQNMCFLQNIPHFNTVAEPEPARFAGTGVGAGIKFRLPAPGQTQEINLFNYLIKMLYPNSYTVNCVNRFKL